VNRLPETKEDYSSKIPALKTLMALGWHYLFPTLCLKKRDTNREVLLKDELINFLKKYHFEYKGNEYPLSPNAIDQIVREVASPGLNEGLLVANERIYDKLCLGITVTEFIDGKKYQPTVPIINWDEITKNTFQVTEEFEVLSSNGTHTRRPDIVCFVNGIPLVVIEAKRPESNNPNKNTVDVGVSQTIRNQKHDEIPLLFSYAQLLLAISNVGGRYATTKTPAKFWSVWHEELFIEQDFSRIKNKKISATDNSALFDDKDRHIANYFSGLWSKPQLPTEQDRLLISLLTPDRFLELVRFFMLFDKKVGKIVARYPQVFGVKALIEQINKRNSNGGREGGVIWHTTGSGKSLTMVLLTKVLILHDSLKDCRVIVVTDRIDLENQLARIFLGSGAFGSVIATRKDGAKAKIATGKELAQRIGSGQDRIIFTIINKFASASKLSECYNPSADLIVLVDEGHRSQNKEYHERMRKALPNAAYVAFTGTPLLKDEKTVNKFGPIVHAYTMRQAVDDGTVSPLLYEERKPELDVNEKAIDNWFEKITINLNDSQKADLKKKFAQKGLVYGSENRIELIAWDIAAHFTNFIRPLDIRLKGQIATDSKLSAIRYKKYLDNTGLVTSAVVISAPDTHEGHEDVDEDSNKDKASAKEIQDWWKKNVGTQTEQHYTRDVLKAFDSDGAPDLVIVANKLLTGFDEPRNTVLYIDKSLKEHSLIQAIARVNRLHEAKHYGLLIDYRGILVDLDTAIKDYQELADKTLGGYALDDIEGLYTSISTEYKRLPGLHKELWAIFKKINNRQDQEQYRQILLPKWRDDEQGHSVDTTQKVREDFYDALTKFSLCLQVALSSSSFFNDSSFSESDIVEYKDDLWFFTNLRKIARQDAQETIDYSIYDQQFRHLVDNHVVANAIQETTGLYNLSKLGVEHDPNEWNDNKTRNETDIIRTRVKKTIEQNLANDPYAKKVFSALLKEIIKQAEALFDHPIKQYALFKEFEEVVNTRQLDTIPEELTDNRHAIAYYGCFRLVLGDDYFESLSNEKNITQFITEARIIDDVVHKAVAEFSLNPLNIETEIRQKLLPELYKLVGMDSAKEIIEQVIIITRFGINGINSF